MGNSPKEGVVSKTESGIEDRVEEMDESKANKKSKKYMNITQESSGIFQKIMGLETG